MKVVAGDFGKGLVIVQRPPSHPKTGSPIAIVFARPNSGTEVINLSAIETIWTGKIRFSDWPGSGSSDADYSVNESCFAEVFLRDGRKALVRGNRKELLEIQAKSELCALLRR